MSTQMALLESTSAVLTVDVAEALDVDAVEALAEGEILAIVVPGFTPQATCTSISQRLIMDHRLSGYATADGAASIKKIGIPLFEAAGQDPEKLEGYYTAAAQTIRFLREMSRPAAYPMDQLRLVLQELWPAGADFETLLTGRKMFVGMPRVFDKSSGALPHVDRLAWDVPGIASARTIIAQIAANIHLRTADEGGEVEIWSDVPDREEYENLRLAGSYGLDQNQLPPPDVVIKPNVGDLILFNSNHIHAVRACHGGPRVTVSCFIAYRGTSKPLTWWS